MVTLQFVALSIRVQFPAVALETAKKVDPSFGVFPHALSTKFFSIVGKPSC